ncbi:uncharacterized protein J3D65DRAFT_630320 [Phyllosticta citribraziliensis]|uniref:Aminodeoxychorismate lyase n=1 Tax=Phyllosticta citribraziliensis TaxID=989973 RepID=A0ABR1LIW5_9PEZI
MSSNREPSFSVFTSLRYDPQLSTCHQNNSPLCSFKSDSPFYMLRYHRDRMLEAALFFEWSAVANQLAGDKGGEMLETALLREVQTWLLARKPHGDIELATKEKPLEKSPLKIRVLFSPTGAMQTDMTPVPQVSLQALFPPTLDLPSDSSNPEPTFTLTLDTDSTPTSPHTLLKTTHRPHYDAARVRSIPKALLPGTAHEVLLWNSVGEVIEGTFTSVYLFRGGRWVTPPVGGPGILPDNERASKDEGQESAGDEGELRSPFGGRWGHTLRSSTTTKIEGMGGQRGTTRRWALRGGLCMEEPVEASSVEVGERLWVSNGVRGFGVGVVVERET